MARILLTGNRGFFGTRFHRIFDAIHTIRGIDAGDVDITDRDAVHAEIGRFKPSLVIHAAAITSTEFSETHRELARRVNVDGAVNAAHAARAAGAEMIFFSTEQVFNGSRDPAPYSENDRPEPNTEYGRTKLEAEQRVREIVSNLWILRFTWLFGLPERGMPVNPNILWNAFRIAAAGRPARVARREFRGHTYGYDMVEAVMRVPGKVPYGTYHIGSRTDLDRFDITRRALAVMGLDDRIDALVQPDNEKYAAGARDVRLDAGLIASHGIRFETTEDAIERCLQEAGMKGIFA